MKKTLLALLFIVSLAPLLLAHGNEKHVLGTVTKISATEITVETKTKEAVTVQIVVVTKFVKSDADALWKDLKVGDHLAILAQPVGHTLEAHEVRFGRTKADAAGQSDERC